MFQLFRNSPGLLITLILLLGGAAVCLLLGTMMKRMGASHRPILWFAGFFMLVVVPQFAGNLVLSLSSLRADAPRREALSKLATDPDPAARDAAAQLLFGPDAGSASTTDARAIFGDAFSQAEDARFAILPGGETVLLARFGAYSAAENAWVTYLRVTGLNQLEGQGDSQRGLLVTRPNGEKVYALHFQNSVGVWTGPDDASIRKRMAAGGFRVPWRAPLDPLPTVATSETPDANPAPGVSAPQPGWMATLSSRWGGPALLALLSAYLFVVVLYYFKGAAWAGTKNPPPGVPRRDAAELVARLEALNALEIPFHIERGSSPDELFATWRYADAHWMDLARARGMSRTFRIRLKLDERSGVVRTTDYLSRFDWSAGRGGAQLAWKASLGIVFFHYEHQRVFGLQFDENGRPKADLSYAYTFKLDEMKSPLIQVVTGAGWKWRPTVWQGPTWLRWLTE
jgi:hypothetical protein